MACDPVSLRELLTLRIEELEAQMQRRLQDMLHRQEKQTQRGDEQLGEMKEALAASRAEQLRMEQADEARLAAAAHALGGRLDDLNHMRRQLEQERALYVDRDRLDAVVKGVDTRFEAVQARIESTERARANLDGRFTAVGFMLFGLSIVLNLVITVFAHLWTAH